MKQFYNIFKDEKVSTLSTQLTWSHYTELLPIKDRNKLLYYLNLCINNNIDIRSLRLRMKSNEYERLPNETKNKLMSESRIELEDLIPNPIIIKAKNNVDVVTENILHKLILEDIESFMKELGNSFSFIGSEYKIKIGERYNYVDILLFNFKYNCFVVVELKVTEFKSEYISQVQKYMNYIDKNVKELNHNKTIGILICKKENNFIVEYCSDEKIIVRKYELVITKY